MEGYVEQFAARMLMDIMSNDELAGKTLLSKGIKTEVRLLFIDFIDPAKLWQRRNLGNEIEKYFLNAARPEGQKAKRTEG